MKGGRATLPLMITGSVGVNQETKLICIFTDLPQARVPQKKVNDIYMEKCSFLFLFCFVVFCILYKT